jgi:hypothetical protein
MNLLQSARNTVLGKEYDFDLLTPMLNLQIESDFDLRRIVTLIERTDKVSKMFWDTPLNGLQNRVEQRMQ